MTSNYSPKSILEQLDKTLEEDNVVTKYLNIIEKKTNIKKRYIVIGKPFLLHKPFFMQELIKRLLLVPRGIGANFVSLLAKRCTRILTLSQDLFIVLLCYSDLLVIVISSQYQISFVGVKTYL